MNCMEIQSHPRRSASSVSSVSRRSPFLLPLPLHLSQQPLPPPSRLELKRRRSALSANSSFPCTGHSGGDRHTSLDRSCSIKAPPLLHRQFSLQCNYGETLETFGQGPRKAITTAVIRPQNLIEEAPFQMSLDPVSNTIPQIRFERAATPLGGMRSENDSKQVPVEFSIPEEDQNEENQNQVLLQLPEVNNHLYISSQSTSHSGSGYGSCVASPYLQSSIPMNMFLDLQQRVSTLESENRILSLCLRQAMGQTDLPERPPL
ncbi:unnamed protein product [Rodentolepis nana]|uniref:Uncharacterized protein n=1 Tax=Rodentolepis nana TaxID=102285 RepID=A0A0R3TKN3_RODNA|nr:unnamed protein product [Rodentolepis nana]